MLTRTFAVERMTGIEPAWPAPERSGAAQPGGSGSYRVMVATPAGGGPGAAWGTGLRSAAAVPATSWRLQRLKCWSGHARAGEGQDDGVVVHGRGEGIGGDGRGHGPVRAGEAAQSGRSGQASGEGSECGGGVAGAHPCLIGSGESAGTFGPPRRRSRCRHETAVSSER
jgi:hypothetical protein